MKKTDMNYKKWDEGGRNHRTNIAIKRFVILLVETVGAAVILLMGLMLYCFGEEILKTIFN